jgi:signal transduction histidine kinase
MDRTRVSNAHPITDGPPLLRSLIRRVFSVANGVALLSCVVAAALTHAIEPSLHAPLFDLFYAAVIVSALIGGVGPGLLAAIVSFLMLNYGFIPPVNTLTLNSTEHLRLSVFIVVAVLTGSLSGRLRRARTLLQAQYDELKRAKQDLEAAHNELEQRIEQRTHQLSEANHRLSHEVAQRAEAEKAIMEISNREQRRLGQDLHDGLSQVLAGLRLMVERVKQNVAGTHPAESEKLAMIETRLAEALSMTDTLSRGLYPVELESNGLAAALEEFASRTSQMHPVSCRYRCWEPFPIADSGTANHVFRIAQEAAHNAIKGGKARRISIRLARRGPEAVLTVADDGVGLGNAPMRKGMGLKLMEYRARVISGRLSFRSRKSGGTLVTCVFPLNETGAGSDES